MMKWTRRREGNSVAAAIHAVPSDCSLMFASDRKGAAQASRRRLTATATPTV